MLIESLSEFYFDLNAYEKYLETWLKGIPSEVGHWRRAMEKNWPDFRDRISNERQCNIEQYFDSPETFCIDIGSGPLSTCGSKTDKTKLRIIAVDPLAHSYKILRKKRNITAGIAPEYCMVERLTDKFEHNTFDIVHMRNSLDHAFNPIFGIMQMMAICKKDGKIVLQHTKNEAEEESYHGFHQWNLSVENGDFIIWRQNDKYNVSKILSEHAEVIIENTSEDRVDIVIIKKSDIGVDICIGGGGVSAVLCEKLFERLSEYALVEAYSMKNNVISVINRVPFLGIIGYKIYKKIHKIRKKRL
ncbi:MAG: class I SAM-dependent methyltransferase [Chitinispirillales bacterium]|jgi:ubiquinone/menaquinone biosynthesis C-methylase UbiE|nr:class I SAM-dependent methyltransferase [Chitinispirillales bacterium]